jgi:tyrosine-protein kinase Etk/Wzc
MTEKRRHNDLLYLEKEVHLLDYLHVVQRRWRIAFLVFLVVFVGVGVKTFSETPIYQSSATLRIGYKQQASEEVLQQRQENRFSIASELRVIGSYEVAEKATELLGLKWQLDHQNNGLDVRLRGLTTPEGVDRLTLVLTEATRYELLDATGQVVLQGETGQVADSGGYRARVLLHSGKAGDTVAIRRLNHEEAVGQVMSGVSAQELEEGTNLIRLSVTGTDPMLATDIANALTSAYVAHDLSNKSSDAVAMLEFIDQQLAKVGSGLDQSEQALHEFRIKTGLERLSSEGQSLVDTAVELEKERADLNLQLERINAFLNDFKWNSYDFTAIGELPGINEFIKQLFSLRASRLDLLRKFTSAHPKVVEVDEQMNQVREKIHSTASLAKSRIMQKLADIGVSLGKSSQRLEQVPEEELELVRLTRANEVNAQLYSYLLQRQQETRITASATSGNVEIIDRAQVPGSPIKPNKKKNLALGLILGLMLGIGLTFLLDYLDRTIKDEDDVQDKLGLPVVGTIPRIKEAENNEEHQLVTQLEPMSPPSEAFLALRTNMLYTITNQKHKTMLLTSCMPDEGKSTVAVNLAATLAQTGARTLLVGCDLRRPSLFVALGETEVPGLTDLLMSGDNTSVRKIEHLNLDFIPAGTEPPNPTQILNSERMRKFLEIVNHSYDYVVIDAPPLLPVSDALILASQVDLNLMVIESCRVPEKMAVRALNSLQKHGANIAGVVLNDKTGRGAKYYGAYSYYEGKYYRGYYRRDEPEPTPSLPKRVLSKVWNFING